MTPDEYVGLIRSKLPGEPRVEAFDDLITDTQCVVIEYRMRLYTTIANGLLEDDRAATSVASHMAEGLRADIRALLVEHFGARFEQD